MRGALGDLGRASGSGQVEVALWAWLGWRPLETVKLWLEEPWGGELWSLRFAGAGGGSVFTASETE